MDHETLPFQVNLGYQVPDNKDADDVGKAELERQKEAIDSGEFPFKESVNPSARKQAKIHARDGMEE